MERKKVYVGLSGGVDSSVAAALLQWEGYAVTGVYMKNWTQDLPGVACPWKEDLADARAVAACLDIPFKVFDFQSEYRTQVVEYMIDEYQAGRTPNPDVMCNQEIKFQLFLNAALADGADSIATGHYARIENGKLLRGVDDNKDQTYFLYRVTPGALSKSIMPIGNYTKPEVRALARQFNLPTADKKDSQGICFVGSVGIKDFLGQYIKAKPGPIMDTNSQQIGQHDGAIFYTIGQRQGLGVGGGGPYYVTGKDMQTNTVFVTADQEDILLQSEKVELTDIHWIDAPPVIASSEFQPKLQVRFRHRGELEVCTISTFDRSGKLSIKLNKFAHSLAPGQSAVLYAGHQVLGGGIIQ